MISGFAAFGYAQMGNILLLLTAAWFAWWTILNLLLAAFRYTVDKDMTVRSKVYVLSVPGLVIGIFSIIGHLVIQSHWFMIVHGVFWVCNGLIFLRLAYVFNRVTNRITTTLRFFNIEL